MGRQSTVFHGRSREIGQIRSALDSTEASVLQIQGMRGIGKTSLVVRAIQGFPHIVVRAPALPDPVQRKVFGEALGLDVGVGADALSAESPPPTWDALFEAAAGRARPGRSPFVLVIDDAHRLKESRARFEQPLERALVQARSAGRALHVVLVGPQRSEDRATPVLSDSETVTVGPLPLRAAVPMLPGSTPREFLRAYGVLGGIPSVLRAVDRSVTLETNVRKLMLEPGAPFTDVPGIWLERQLQTPSRYNAVLAHLASGPSDWGSLHKAVPDLTSSGQLAPYVHRLEELGLVQVRRSLDAPPSSRARRYQITDPFLAFWYRFIHPITYGHGEGPGSPDLLVRGMRADLESHLEGVFPRICRQHMRYDARETLGANARELGGLWAPGYEIPIAGILTSGAAFYGTCFWRNLIRGEDPLGPLDEGAKETRYGFGREHRLRLVFTSTEATRWLERAAVRREQFVLIGPKQLIGS